MGIINLLPFLQDCIRPCNLSELRNKIAAVDTYCLLHKGARSCAQDLVMGKESTLYVSYVIKYVKMLIGYDIQPIMVFDGRHLPAKLNTEKKRAQDRKRARQTGLEMLRLGRDEEAKKCFKQCVEVTPQMALEVMKECRNLGVECIVAPYESDAQLAYLCCKGIANFVVTEDSDLVVFGCGNVLYKLDLNGNGQYFEAEQLPKAMKVQPQKFSFDKFRHMCILSGCDYVKSLHGVGLQKALKFVNMTAETDPRIFLDRLPRYLNLRNIVVTPEYKQDFMRAEATFLYQLVYDSRNRKLVRLTDLTPDFDEIYCENAGQFFDEDQALQLALGNLDPLTMNRINNYEPQLNINKLPTSNYISIWTQYEKLKASVKRKKCTEIAEFEHSQLNIRKREIIVAHTENTVTTDYNVEERDLSIFNAYKRINNVPEVDENNDENKEEAIDLPEIEPPQIETSPVLNRVNPFLKTFKKVSPTIESINRTIKSRYFDKNSIEVTDLEENTTVSTGCVETNEEYSEVEVISETTIASKRETFSCRTVTRKTSKTPIKQRKTIKTSQFKPTKGQPTILDIFKMNR